MPERRKLYEGEEVDLTPVAITAEKIQKLKDHLNNRFNIFSNQEVGKEEIDLDRCQINIGYSIGSYYTTYNGLLMKERMRLADLEGNLALAKAKAIDDIKRNRLQYTTSSKEEEMIIEGHKFCRIAKANCKKQVAYVKFLENAVTAIGFYSNGVKTILERERLRGREGL